MFLHLLILAVSVSISVAQYDDWKVYKGADPDNFDKDGPTYVMYTSATLDEDLKAHNGGKGIHVSVHTGAWEPYKKGRDIHSSWNTDVDGNRVNDFHWGYGKYKNAHDKWYGDIYKIKKKQNEEEGKEYVIPTKAQLKPLKQAFDAFVKGKIIGDDGQVKKVGDKPIHLFQDPEKKKGVTDKAIPAGFAAHRYYANYYDSDSDESLITHHTKKSQSHSHYIANHRARTEDTDSSSINIPTVFVTLISCMFIFVVCAVYTGCIGLIAAAIGYKMKQSEQTSKVQSFEEI